MTKHEVTTEKSELMSTAEVARMLEAGQRSVWRWSRSGVMPEPLYIAGAVRFRRSEILQWIGKGCPKCSETDTQPRQEKLIKEAERQGLHLTTADQLDFPNQDSTEVGQ